MLRNCVTFVLTVFFLIAGSSFTTTAYSKEKKSRTKITKTSKSKTNKKSKSKKKKSRYGKARAYKSGNGPDLRALTTESKTSEYTETPDNGVNSVETKQGL